MALDIRSPMDLVYECFVKLGLRYVCVTKEGRYAGLVGKPSKAGQRVYKLTFTPNRHTRRLL